MVRTTAYKVWHRWKTHDQNTNQIAKALYMTEPEVDAMIMARLNRDRGRPARFSVVDG